MVDTKEFKDKYLDTIVCSGCLTIMADWPDNCVDLVVTSPPYDDLRDYRGYSFDFENIAAQLFRVLKKGGIVVWVVNDATVDGSETGTSFKQALYFKQLGFNLHDTMIYAKKGFSFPSIDRYHQVFEFMFVLSKGRPDTFNPIKDRINLNKRMGGDAKRQKDGSVKKGDDGGGKLDYHGQRFNIWQYATGGGLVSTDRIAHEHPAIFPEQLAKDHILSWSNPGHLVIDIFSGSGTTATAAKILGRHYIGIDISEEYCEIARMRLKAVDMGVPVKEQLKGQMGLFE